MFESGYKLNDLLCAGDRVSEFTCGVRVCVWARERGCLTAGMRENVSGSVEKR